MFSLPSAHRLIVPALVVLLLITLTRLFAYHWIPSQADILRAALKTQIKRGVQIHLRTINASSSSSRDRYDEGHAGYGINVATHHDPVYRDFLRSLSPSPEPEPEPEPEQSQQPMFPPAHSRLIPFLTCNDTAAAVSPHTLHLRLEAHIYNIALTTPSTALDPTARFFNPAIIPLPYWSSFFSSSSSSGTPGAKPKYALVSRLVTTGFHQESHICLADICAAGTAGVPPPAAALAPDTRRCTADDLAVLGPHGGMRCTSAPVKINIPSTPAEHCAAAWRAFPDIPGFHDPRVFWSGKGEPLILVNSASRYGCVGLWVVDLRRVFPELDALLARSRQWWESHQHDEEVDDGHRQQHQQQRKKRVEDSGAGIGGASLMSYPHLTEITRSPRSSRRLVEKNWLMWFPNREEAYVQYDLLGQNTLPHLDLGLNETVTTATRNATSTVQPGNTTHEIGRRAAQQHIQATPRKGGRTFAKLIGNGFTTRNLTSPYERPCFSGAHNGSDHEKDRLNNTGHWHQGSNALRVLLCTRPEVRRGQCDEDDAVQDGRSLHFAVVHRKFSNVIHLPLRYERYVVVWEGRKPFRVLAVSKFPLLMAEEWARPWSEEDNWPEGSGESGNAHNKNEKGEELGTNENETRVKAVKKEQRSGKPDRLRTDHDKPNENFNADEPRFPRSQASFTYTPSLAWSWKPHSAGLGKDEEENDENDDVEYMSRLGTGYLGDEVLVGIGMDDVSQGYAKVKVESLLQCLRLCPGVDIAGMDVS